VLGGSANRAGAGIRRLVGLVAAAVVCVLVLGAPAATAQQRTTTNPAEELWRAYPLEQTPTTSGGEARPPSSAPRRAADDDSGSGSSWIVAVAGGALFALVLAAGIRQRRRGGSEVATAEPATQRRAAAAPPRPAAAEASRRPAPPRLLPTPTEQPQRAAGRAQPTPAQQLQRPAARAQPRAVPAQPRPAGGRQGRAARPRRASSSSDPVCQVRWSATGGFFYAATTDAHGNEHRVARSPRLDWRGPAPPDQEAEVEVALRVLAKELRDRGWRPLRTKGIDAGERRWYARRFRWPTEAEASVDPQDDAPVARTQAKRGEA
jgi:hypothetical protein